MSEPKGTKKPWQGQGTLNNATPVVLKSVTNTTGTIFVTRLTLSITTHANGKLFTARDSTPTTFAVHTDTTAGAGVPSVVIWEWGTQGYKLTVNTNLEVLSEAAGIAGTVYAEGYEMYTP